MKRILVIMILFVLIGGAGAGGLIMLGAIPNPFNPKIPMSGAEAAAAAKKAAMAAKAFDAPASVIPFVNMRDLVIPVLVQGQTRPGSTSVFGSGSAPGQADAVEALEPKYDDAVLAEFVPYFSDFFVKDDMLNLV